MNEIKAEDIPTCKTCDYWSFPNTHPDAMPICSELRFWIAVDRPIHTSANFGCNRHSKLVHNS